MLNLRIITRVFSLLLIFEGLFMMASGAVSFLYHEHAATSFLYSALITIITGVIVFTPLRSEEKIVGNKEGYVIATGMWVIVSLFGTLPFILSGSINNFSDAFFETMSGFTTTGASVIIDVESMPRGILFWRSITQWLGGIGIIFISLSVFPIVRSINIHLAATEFSGQPTDKIHPRTIEAAKRLIFIYLAITLAEIILLVLGKMPLFDAVCHSFSTLSTGGFSTHNNELAAFSSPYIKIVITVFMFIAGTNISIVYFGLKGNFSKIKGNNEFVFYLMVCLIFILATSGILFYKPGFTAGKALLEGAFHVISLVSTTGYYTQDYNLWGNAIFFFFFILMLTGGSAGSTGGGIKIVRLLLISKNSRQEIKRLIHPNGYMPVRLNGHVVPQNTIYNMLVFIAIYFIVMCFGVFVISIMGYDITTAFSTSASMLGNIGPGIGQFGPFHNYSSVPEAGKWFLSALMLLGRLELVTVMIIFTRKFYRN